MNLFYILFYLFIKMNVTMKDRNIYKIHMEL